MAYNLKNLMKASRDRSLTLGKPPLGQAEDNPLNGFPDAKGGTTYSPSKKSKRKSKTK